MFDSRHAQATPPAADDQSVETSLDTEPSSEVVLREPPLDSTFLDRPSRADVPSLGLALGGTFVLRCASYAAGLLVLVSLGIKSRSEADVTAGVASLVAVTFYASELIGAPLFGAWSDRVGRKPFMILGAVLGGIAAQLMGWTMLIPVLVLVRILQGLSTATAAPATLGFLSAQTATSEKLRGRAMGLYEAATVVGLALGAAVGGKLHDQFGALAFTMVALMYVLALLPFIFLRDRAWVPRVKTSHSNLVARMMNRRIMRFAPAWLAANAVLGAWFSVGPFLAAGAPNRAQFLMRGFSPGEIGTAYLAFGILFTVGAITWGFVMPSIGQLLGGALAAPFAERLGINGLIILTGLLCLIALFTVMLLGQSERRYARALVAA